MLERLAIFLVRRRIAVILVVAAVTLVFMHFMYELRINENFEESIYRGDLAYEDLRSTMEKLGHDDMILVAVECGDVLLERNQGLIRELHARLEDLPSVRRVVSLANAEDLVSVDGELSYRKVTAGGPGRSRESVAADLRANPIYSSILASDDLQAAAFYLQLDPEMSSDTVVGKQVVGDVLRVVEGFRAETGIKTHVVGPPVLRGAWTDRVMRDLCIFVPVAMLLVVGALYAIFRSFYLTILPFVIILYRGLFYLEWNGLLSSRSDPGARVAGEYMSLYFLEGFGMLVFGVVAYQIARDYRGRERLMEVGAFVLGLSHELKTPLPTVLLGVTRLAPGTVVREEDVEAVRRNVHRVKNLVNSVLDYGSTGKVPLRPVPAVEAVELGVEMARAALRDTAAGVRIELETDPGRDTVVMADKEWLARALANIVKNAVEASGEEGLVTVSLRAGDALWAAIEVRDHGAGMPGETMGRIFEPFFTTKGTGRGYGLGLAVARRIVEAHGSAISVESGPAAGTLFTVRIPLADGFEAWGCEGGAEVPVNPSSIRGGRNVRNRNLKRG